MDSEKEKHLKGAATLAVDTLGKDILEALLTEVRNIPNSWAQLGPIDQENVIDRLRLRVQVMLRDAVAIMFAGETPAVKARLASLKFGKGLQVVLDVGRDESGRHDLMDAVGQPVVLIMADPSQYMAAMETVKARAAQGDLFGGPLPIEDMPEDHEPVTLDSDGDYVARLYWLGVDVRAPQWSKLPESTQQAARIYARETLTPQPASFGMPECLLPYLRFPQDIEPNGTDEDPAAALAEDESDDPN